MAVSRDPAQPKVTLLYDTRLPVSLRLRGFDLEAKKEEAPSALNVLLQKSHAASPHVLALRVNAPQAAAPILKRETPAQDFNAFAQEFFAHLSLEETLPEREEALDAALLSGQLMEDDCATPARHPVLPSRYKNLLELPRAILLQKFASSRLLMTGYQLPSLSFLHPSLRGVGVFVLLSFVFVLPLQAMQSRPDPKRVEMNILAQGTKAFALFEEGAKSAADTDFEEATHRFAEAGEKLTQAQATLNDLGGGARAIASLIPSQGETLKTGRALLDLGLELSLSAERMGDGLTAIGNLADTTLGTKVEVLERYLASALPHLSAATEALSRVDTSLVPAEYQERFEELSRVLPGLEDNLNRLQAFSEALKGILGNDAQKRYLFVFQNDTEIRPAGGFIGSFAEVDVLRGEIERINLPGDGSYNLQGSLQLRVESPKPLSLLNARWEFQDANWFPDFKASAQKLLEFHASAGGPTVDGVIAVNARFVADLLNILGPVEMPSYGRTITAENFLLETQKIVEVEYNREENEPKRFLSDLAPELLSRIQNIEGSSFLPLLESLKRGLNQKDIQLYFTDTQAQAGIRKLGWSGEMADTSGDYLMAVNANIGGGKTDAVIEEDMDVASTILEDGRIQNTVTITRTHHGIAGAPFTGVNNVNYVALYVPRGSRLIGIEGATPPPEDLFESSEVALSEDADLSFINASAFKGPGETDVSELHGKTVFGNWTQTKPGQSTSIVFTYELPFTVDWMKTNAGFFTRAGAWLGIGNPSAHTLMIEPQSGMRERTTQVSISFPEDQTPVWTTDLVENHRLEATIKGTSSGFFGLLFE